MKITKPWSKTIVFDKASLNSALDGGDIADHELKTASHVLLDNGVIEKGTGRTQLGAVLEGGVYAVDGGFRSHNKDGDKKHLVYCNGKLFYYTGSAWSSAIKTGLAKSSVYPGLRGSFINYKDKTLFCNGVDEALEFDPADNSIRTYGLEPARWYKKVNYFEPDDETIIQVATTGHDGNAVSGTAVKNTQFFDNTERTGDTKTSLILEATAGNRAQGYVDFGSGRDFSVFANGKSFEDDDYVVLKILHRTRIYVSSITIDFYTSAGNYTRGTIATSELDPTYLRDNQWTTVKIKKSRFIDTGSPNLASIARCYYSLTAVTGTATVYIDDVHLESTPIEASAYRKIISTMDESYGDWTKTSGTLSDDVTHVKEGTKSIKAVNGTSFHKTVTLNLTIYIDGVTSQLSDEICYWAYVSDWTLLTSVTLTLTGTGGTQVKTSLAADFNKPSGWTEIRIVKSAFTGSGSWSVVTDVKIDVAGSAALEVSFDSLRLEEASLQTTLSTMEPGETNPWLFPDDADSGEGEFNNNQNYLIAGDHSIKLTVKKNKSYYAYRVLGTTVDLTQYSGSKASGTDDIISFWMYWQNFKHIRSVELYIDCSTTGDFATDYFKYELLPSEIQEALNATGQEANKLNNKGASFEVKKSSFTRVGSSANSWDDIKGYKIIVNSTTTGDSGKNSFYFDQLQMIRKKGLTGIYQWCCVPMEGNGTRGAPSGWSKQVTITGARALLRNLPISPDTTRCSARENYRKGGDIGSIGRLAFTIYDNTTTTYFDDVKDASTTSLLSDERVPSGTIRLPLFGKWGPIFKGRLTGFRDPSNLKTLYWSNSGFGYAWSELQAWEFDTDILDVFLMSDILYVNCKSGMKRITVDLGDMTSKDIQEMGFVKNAVSTWGGIKVDELYAYVSYDGCYIFDGYSSKLISEMNGNVKNYFDPVSYDITEVVLFYRKKHLYISVESLSGSRTLLDCYLPTGQWSISDYIVNCAWVLDGQADNAELYAGDLLGNIWKMDTGYATTTIIETKAFDAGTGNPFDEILLKEIWIKAKSDSTSTGTLVIEFLVDQVLVVTFYMDTPASGDISSTYKTYFGQLQGVHDYLKGSKISIRVTHSTPSKHFALESLYLVGEITGLPNLLEEETGVSAVVGLYLGNLMSDPDTSGWGTADEGKFWYNTTDNHWKGWNGAAVHVLG